MKKNIKYVLFIMLFIFALFAFSSNVKASVGSTVFIGEPIVLNDYKDIEITYNEVTINEETSKVKNLGLFTNLSNETLTRKASIKLEDSYQNFTINSLKIWVNDLEIKEIEKQNDTYSFYFQIKPNETKKIEIAYATDNNLQNAKIIKYSLEPLKGKNVKIFQIKVNMCKYDIPLVQKIWPGAYDFSNNVISSIYTDFTVNNLTGSFIIQKDTYKNIKYGENSDELSDIDEYILKNAHDFIDGKMPEIEYNGQKDILNVLTKWMNKKEYETGTDKINNSLYSVYCYSIIKKASSENKIYEKISNDIYTTLYYYDEYIKNNCLAYILCSEFTKESIVQKYYPNIQKNSVGKMIAINYYETEQGKDLYVNKDTNNLRHAVEGANFVLTKRDEYSILRTIVAEGAPISNLNKGIKKVFVNSDIEGNKIDVTEEEIIDFINMMNVDLYIRIVLYDPWGEYSDVLAGYYTEDAKQIAMDYIETQIRINDYENSIKEIQKDTSSYLTAENKERMIQNNKESIEKIKKQYKLFDNDVVKNKSKVPTVAHCVGKCEYKDGKYIIEFNNTADLSGLFYIYGATENQVAKDMLKANKENNDKKLNSIVTYVKNLKITNDVEEFKKDNSFIEDNKKQENTTDEINKVIKDNIVIVTFAGVILLILLLILIILFIRRRKNGRK